MTEESTKRRQFTPEVKREAIRLPLESGRTPGEMAREPGMQPVMLRAWRRQFAQSAVPPDASGAEWRERCLAGQVTSEDEEIRRPTRQVELRWKCSGRSGIF
jgi:transposase-like protein